MILPPYSPAQRAPDFIYQNNINSIREAARGHWPFILASLGIPTAYLKNKHGACPICRAGKDRFRFDDKGKGLYFCNKCGAGDGFKLLQLYYGWDFLQALNNVAGILGFPCNKNFFQPKHTFIKPNHSFIESPNNGTYNRKKKLIFFWQSAKSIITGDPVDRYLKARGIKLNTYPKVLRYHPKLPYYDDTGSFIGCFPAMLALVQDKNNKGISIHRTYLGEGRKADVPKPKKLMPPIHPGALNGTAIRLLEPIDGQLAIAEGIETALAFHIATQMPIWSTMSAGGMERVNLPKSVTHITIAIDHDESNIGQEAADKLKKRLLAEGRSVGLVKPRKVGQDFNDLLLENSL